MKELAQLKDDFHRWYGLLSIQEIMSNPGLIKMIEQLERMLLQAGA